MADRLAGKIAIVTGMAHGIGRETALRFAVEGATVIGTDINVEGANSAALEAKELGAEIRVVAPCDMLAADRIAELMDGIGNEFGRIDVLVNAAALIELGWIEDLPLAKFRRTLMGEVDSVFIACQAAWPHLKAAEAASIINFASVAAHGAVDQLPQLAHSAGKGAVLAMTRQLAMEGAAHDIRANCISPGMVVTPATQPALEGMPEFADAIKRKLMLKRYGQPADIAAGCVYLASDESNWVTGSDLAIDGGMTAW